MQTEAKTMVEALGKRQSVYRWSLESCLSPQTIRRRLTRGWPVEVAVSARPWSHSNRSPGRKCCLTFAVEGVTRTVVEWSKICGISSKTLRARIRLGWDPLRATTDPVKRFAVKWNGKRMTISDLSRETGVPYPRLMSRLNRGWPIEAAVNPKKVMQSWKGRDW